VAWRGPAVFIARPAAHAAARAWLRSVRPAGCRARFAAGVTWTCRTTSAGWAARESHTSVIDAAGAIYVIGGYSYPTYLQDVWASTDGGARPDSVGGGRWVLGVYSGVLGGYSGGTMGY
jgi:hypothetical protein